MTDGKQIELERYRSMQQGGGSASTVYARIREDGHGKIDGVRIVRELFALSFEDANAVIRESNLPIDRNPYELAPVRSYDELEKVLKDELGYCGCAAYADSIEVLRDVLRHASDWQASLDVDDANLREQANIAMLERICYDQVPGLATWFLYLLDQRGMIDHAGRVTTCWITPKGRQLLAAIEQWYPPTRNAKDDTTA